MKKIFTLLMAFTLCISCSSDDDSGNESESQNPVGSWILNSVTSATSFDLNGDGQGSNDLLIETGCLQNETLVFADDNTAIAFSTSFLDIFVEIDTSTNEATQVIDCIEEIFNTELTWTLDGNVVSINDGEETINAAINGDNLSFMLPGGLFLEVLEGDAVVELNENVTFSYRRL